MGRKIERGKALKVSPLRVGQRFTAKIVRFRECWLWGAYIDRDGYGRFNVDGTWALAHRVSWSMANGYLPSCRDVHHRCKTRDCVNPNHLELLTRRKHTKCHHDKPA